MRSERPAPRITEISRPFWEGCNAGKLMLQRCASPICARYIFYPRVCCPFCGCGDLEWHAVSGRGVVRSFTIVHRPGHDAFLAETPYLFAAVALDEGPLIYGRLATTDRQSLIGRRVAVAFDDEAAGQKLPGFVLDEAPAGESQGQRVDERRHDPLR